MDDDEEDYGVEEAPLGLFSPLWMLETALAHVPFENLYHGVIEMVDYLVSAENAEVAEALDRLVQNALTGHFHHPYHDEEETAEPMSEAEIEAQMQDFSRVLKGLPVIRNKMNNNEEENNNGDS